MMLMMMVPVGGVSTSARALPGAWRQAPWLAGRVGVVGNGWGVAQI